MGALATTSPTTSVTLAPAGDSTATFSPNIFFLPISVRLLQDIPSCCAIHLVAAKRTPGNSLPQWGSSPTVKEGFAFLTINLPIAELSLTGGLLPSDEIVSSDV